MSQYCDNIYIGALPLESHIPELIKNGIRVIISLNEDFEIKYSGLTDERLKQHRITRYVYSTVDRHPVSADDMRSAIAMITAGLSKGNIYIHCKAGRGRSAMLLVAYLKHKQPEKSIDLIIKDLKSKRPQISINRSQKNALRSFFNEVLI